MKKETLRSYLENKLGAKSEEDAYGRPGMGIKENFKLKEVSNVNEKELGKLVAAFYMEQGYVPALPSQKIPMSYCFKKKRSGRLLAVVLTYQSQEKMILGTVQSLDDDL